MATFDDNQPELARQFEASRGGDELERRRMAGARFSAINTLTEATLKGENAQPLGTVTMMNELFARRQPVQPANVPSAVADTVTQPAPIQEVPSNVMPIRAESMHTEQNTSVPTVAAEMPDADTIRRLIYLTHDEQSGDVAEEEQPIVQAATDYIIDDRNAA